MKNGTPGAIEVGLEYSSTQELIDIMGKASSEITPPGIGLYTDVKSNYIFASRGISRTKRCCKALTLDMGHYQGNHNFLHASRR